MKELIKAPKIKLSDEEIANLSNAELKTLVIRMLTEMVEYGLKIGEKVKATQSEVKRNVQGTNSEGKETGTQINDLEQKEESSFFFFHGNWPQNNTRQLLESVALSKDPPYLLLLIC